VDKDADALQISERTLRRARQKLGIRPFKTGVGKEGPWWLDMTKRD
jgi:hypothetical protein